GFLLIPGISPTMPIPALPNHSKYFFCHQREIHRLDLNFSGILVQVSFNDISQSQLVPHPFHFLAVRFHAFGGKRIPMYPELGERFAQMRNTQPSSDSREELEVPCHF